MPALETLSKSLNATLINSPAVYLEQDRLRRHGQEIWKVFLAILLVFMFLVNVVGAMLLLPALAYWLDLGSVAQTRATRPQPRTTPA